MGVIVYGMAPLRDNERPEDRIRQKHNEYYLASRRYKILYYATRLVGGLCAGILPFVVYTAPAVATGLAIAIVVVTVCDSVFSPKERWKTNSRASDLLYVADLKKNGKYKEFEEALNIIITTEDEQMLQLLGLVVVMRKANTKAEGQTPKPGSESPSKLTEGFEPIE
jgi:hypothetical protein